MLDELPDDQRAALEAIVEASAGWSWTKPPAGAALEAWRLDLEGDYVPRAEADRWLDGLNGHAPAIGPLEAVGLVERWALPDGSEAIVLSSLAAERLGVQLSLVGYREALPRWCRPAEMPRCLKTSRAGIVGQLDLPELVIDPAPGPAEIATWSYLDHGDLVTGPLRLFGLEIPVDPRLGKGGRKASAPRCGARAKGR